MSRPVAILSGGFIAARGLRIAFRVVLLTIVALVLYTGVTFVQVWHASTQNDHDPTQVIIVLGAAQYNGRPSPVLAARLDHAIELYNGAVAPSIVVTGGKQSGDQFTEAAASYMYLRDRGVPDFAILREEQGTNTWEQLAATSRFLQARGIDEAVLVSDDYHALRLEAIADELGLDAQVSPVDPNLSVSGRVRAFGKETVAVAVGRVIGFRRLVNLDEQLNS